MESLIRSAQMGDTVAFQHLVEAYYALAWRTARVLQHDAAGIEDILQEAWLDAWRGLPGFQAHRPFRPWLLTLVTNRCRMAARRHTPPTVGVDALEDHLVSDDMLQHVLQQERNAQLRATLATLPTEQQRVLALRYFAELELSEIALVMGLPLGTVKSRLHRALQTLRQKTEGLREYMLEEKR